jgi:CheY-like chemotaxis protein
MRKHKQNQDLDNQQLANSRDDSLGHSADNLHPSPESEIQKSSELQQGLDQEVGEPVVDEKRLERATQETKPLTDSEMEPITGFPQKPKVGSPIRQEDGPQIDGPRDETKPLTEVEMLNPEELQDFLKQSDQDVTAREEVMSIIESMQNRLDVLEASDRVDNDEKVQLLDVAYREAIHLTNRLGGLLVDYQVEVGKFDLSKESIQINQLLKETIDQARPKAAYKGVTLELSTKDEAFVEADLSLLSKTFTTILDSIIQFTSRGAIVLIRTRLEDNRFYIQYTDNGGGMTEEVFRSLLDKLSEATVGSIEDPIVLDLSLLATKPIIEAHGGRIWFERETTRHGSLFIELPSARPQERRLRKGRKVLIVDDDLVGTLLTEQVLNKAGFETLKANNGADGLAMAQWEDVGLIILDVMLPGMDGYEVCRRLRSEEDTKPLPIVMISAKGRDQDRTNGLSAGADVYLTKPLKLTTLVSTVNVMLAGDHKAG